MGFSFTKSLSVLTAIVTRVAISECPGVETSQTRWALVGYESVAEIMGRIFNNITGHGAVRIRFHTISHRGEGEAGPGRALPYGELEFNILLLQAGPVRRAIL